MYRALAHTASEVIWLQSMFKELHVPNSCESYNENEKKNREAMLKVFDVNVKRFDESSK